MMQNYSKNPKPARNETKFNNTKKWRNRLDYTTFLIDSYFCLSLFLENYLTSSKSASWMSSLPDCWEPVLQLPLQPPFMSGPGPACCCA